LFSGALAFSTFFLRLILVNWYVLEKTNSSFLVGILGSIPILIQPLASPIGGKFADQYSRKHVLFITRIIEATSFLLLAIFINANISPLWSIGLMSLLVGLSGGINAPSWKNMLVDILGLENISKGNAITELINGIVNSVLPTLAALLLTIFTVSQLFWSLPIVSYFSGLLIFFMVIKMPPQKTLESTEDTSISDSINYVFKNDELRPIIILGASLILWGITQPLIPIYCRDFLNLDGTGYSLMTTAFFIGNMFGSIILVIFGSRLATGKLLSFYMFMYAAFSYLFFSFTDVFLSGICLFLSGAFISIWNANVFNLIQTISDEKYMGRVVSFFFTMFILIGLGFILGGIFGDIIGINLTILISCLAVIILHILIIVSSKKYRLLKLQ
tara:strand:- start:659 stop:1819 length:1161 start_codon:yes stop_codon:yes gene_type:complete